MAPKPSAKKQPKQVSFEKALSRLEIIVDRLESGEETLDESLKLFSEGVEARAACDAILEQADQKIERLQKSAAGKLNTRPFEAEVDDGGGH